MSARAVRGPSSRRRAKGAPASHEASGASRLEAFATRMAESLLAVIEQAREAGGVLPWRRSWEDSLPRNPVTGHRYTGGNRLMLELAMMLSGWYDGRFLTFKQALDLGGAVRRGEHGIGLLMPRVIEVDRSERGRGERPDRPENVAMEDEDGTRKVVIFRGYTVFHVSQVEGLPDLVVGGEGAVPEAEAEDPGLAECLAFIDRLPALIGVPVREGPSPFYAPEQDAILMPPREAFRARDGVPGDAFYGSVLLHEWYHATGHDTRERRFPGPIPKRDTPEYAREELRAEMFSLMASRSLGLPFDLTDHAAYIASWQKLVADAPSEVYRAAATASRALGAVEAVAAGEQPALAWWPKDAVAKEAGPSEGFRVRVDATVEEPVVEVPCPAERPGPRSRAAPSSPGPML